MSESIEIKLIDKKHKADINILNEPFKLFGRFLPTYTEGKWSYTTEKFDSVTEMCFPDENYDFDELSKNSFFLGAYDRNDCIGLAIYQQSWNKYLYLYDLKVNSAYRGQKIGSQLISKGLEIAHAQGYRGIYTQAQDNNLAACLFYLSCGFRIGGIDTDVYIGTKQEDKIDVLFYLG